MVIDDTGSVEDIHAFIYCKKWRFGRVSRMPDRLTTLKDRTTQLLIKYKSGALVTQQVSLFMACSGYRKVSGASFTGNRGHHAAHNGTFLIVGVIGSDQ